MFTTIHLPLFLPPSRFKIPLAWRAAISFSIVRVVTVFFPDILKVFPDIYHDIIIHRSFILFYLSLKIFDMFLKHDEMQITLHFTKIISYFCTPFRPFFTSKVSLSVSVIKCHYHFLNPPWIHLLRYLFFQNITQYVTPIQVPRQIPRNAVHRKLMIALLIIEKMNNESEV